MRVNHHGYMTFLQSRPSILMVLVTTKGIKRLIVTLLEVVSEENFRAYVLFSTVGFPVFYSMELMITI